MKEFKTTNKEIAALSFDVMWAVLTALKNTYEEYPLEDNTKEKGSLEFTLYLKKQLQNLNFEGITVSKLISIEFLNILSYSENTYKEYPLENHTKELTEILEKQLQNLSFEGLTVSKLISIESREYYYIMN